MNWLQYLGNSKLQNQSLFSTISPRAQLINVSALCSIPYKEFVVNFPKLKRE